MFPFLLLLLSLPLPRRGSLFGFLMPTAHHHLGVGNDSNHTVLSEVVSTHLWNTPLNLYQQAIKGFFSQLARGIGWGVLYRGVLYVSWILTIIQLTGTRYHPREFPQRLESFLFLQMSRFRYDVKFLLKPLLSYSPMFGELWSCFKIVENALHHKF